MAEELGTTAKNVRDPTSHETGKLVIIGSGVYMSKPAKPLIKWLYHSPSLRGKKAAVFVTTGDIEQGHQTADWITKVLESKGATVVDRFVCRGQFMIVSNFGHPDKHEQEAARTFASKLAKYAPKPKPIPIPEPVLEVVKKPTKKSTKKKGVKQQAAKKKTTKQKVVKKPIKKPTIKKPSQKKSTKKPTKKKTPVPKTIKQTPHKPVKREAPAKK